MSEKTTSNRAWPLLESEPGPDLKVFRSRFEWRRNPRNQSELKCLILESLDWVNIVALTRDERIVLVRQFRFGRGGFTIEIPGGAVDPGEEHGDAARRELREETGYGGGRWRCLGTSEPNPAFLNNLCHHWLAEGVERRAEPSLDRGEDIEPLTASRKELAEMVADGRLRHSLALLALYQARWI